MKRLLFVAMVSLLFVLSGTAGTGNASSAGMDGWSHAGSETDAPASANAATAVTAGGGHTCALTTGGGVKCWGGNGFGQLGDGTTTLRATPVDVTGLSSGVAAVAAGDSHTCAVTSEGGLKCWGGNFYGQLGDGTLTDSTGPVDVVGLATGVVSVAAGSVHTCAVTVAGGLKCWGDNAHGQLGDGTTTDRTTPVSVVGLTSGVAAVAAGDSQTCALTTGGGLKCWGWNSSGQLGDGTLTDRATPVDVTGLTSDVTAVTTGAWHTCALTTGGGVKCWGSNGSGQVGDGTYSNRAIPVDVVGQTTGVAEVEAGQWHTCALTTGGGVKCWGSNAFGVLGDGTTTSGAAAISAGKFHSCALATTGGLQCWGYDFSGQLGDGQPGFSTTAVDVAGLTSGVTAMTAGAASMRGLPNPGHTCALTIGGGLKCWGANGFGELGDGTNTGRTTPVDVVGLPSGAAAASAGGFHTCALTSGGGLKCWGYNWFGELGDDTTTDRTGPVDVIGLTSGVAGVAAGDFHTCAVISESTGVKCWGYNYYGQLGDGTSTNRWMPVDVVALTSGVTAVAAGGSHTCALTIGGGLKCWGDNDYGQLGDGTTTDRTTPVEVVGLTSGVAAVTAGGSHTCAITTGGGLKCWGDNTTTPVDVLGLTSDVAAVAAGAGHTCALTIVGGVKCWGGNWSGALGDGTTISRTMPVDVTGLTTGVAAVAAGDQHTCALTTGGGLKCWGYNFHGELGNGEAAFRTTPRDVVGFESDADGDGIYDGVDNCPTVSNGDQSDTDGDGVGTVCDNCPDTVNPDQLDTDSDGSGDACDPDDDADGTVDLNDNCPIAANPDQANDDGDSRGDLCDNCPKTPNDGQEDTDGDLAGDACDGPGSGNVDCSPPPSGVSAVDALKILRAVAALPVSQNEPCMDIGVGPLASGWTQGDVNCSGAVNAVDALMVLRVVAGLPASIPQGCPAIRPAPP